MSARRIAIVLALVVGVIALEWQLIPLPSPRGQAQAPDAWRALQQQPAPQVEMAIGVLTATNPWGRLTGLAEQPSLNPPQWRIVGITSRGSEKLVLIKTERQPDSQLRIGDALPGGSTILQINEDSLCLLVEGQKRMLPLYPQGPRAL